MPWGPAPWRYPGWGGYRKRPNFGLSIEKPGFGFDIGKSNAQIMNYPLYPSFYPMPSPMPFNMMPTTMEFGTKFEKNTKKDGVFEDQMKEREKRGLFVPHWGRKKDTCPPGTKDAFGWECIPSTTRYPHTYDIYW